MFVIGDNKLLSKQDEKVSQSEEHSSTEESSACSKPMNVLVHVECGEIEFPVKIKYNNYNQFYGKVVSTIDSKVPDFKSHCMQFKCGKKWYSFNQSTGFDALCLDEDDPEMTIQLIPISSEPGNNSK